MTVSSLEASRTPALCRRALLFARVNLIERSGGDGEFYVSDEVVDVFFAPDNVCFVAEDDVCFVWVDVLHDGFDVRELRCDVFDDLRFVREIVCSCDEDDHHLTCNDTVSYHDVAEPAFVAFFVVRFDTVFGANVFDGLNGFVVLDCWIRQALMSIMSWLLC